MQTSSQIDNRWFIGRLADKQISQRKLAKHLGLDPAAVSLMLRGKRKMSASEAADIARLLGVGTDEVLARAGAGVFGKRASGPSERVEATTPAPPVGAIESDAQFLMRWMELGNYLLSRR